MQIHRRGLLALAAVIALFALAIRVELGIAAILAAAIIDWTYLSAPFLPWGRGSSHRTTR